MNLDYMLALWLNVNANDNDHFPERNYFDKYYMSLVKISQ